MSDWYTSKRSCKASGLLGPPLAPLPPSPPWCMLMPGAAPAGGRVQGSQHPTSPGGVSFGGVLGGRAGGAAAHAHTCGWDKHPHRRRCLGRLVSCLLRSLFKFLDTQSRLLLVCTVQHVTCVCQARGGAGAGARSHTHAWSHVAVRSGVRGGGQVASGLVLLPPPPRRCFYPSPGFQVQASRKWGE